MSAAADLRRAQVLLGEAVELLNDACLRLAPTYTLAAATIANDAKDAHRRLSNLVRVQGAGRAD